MRKVGGKMIANILVTSALFFIQPIFLIGLILSYIKGSKRKKRERNYFNVAINKKSYEIKDYLLGGLVIGIISSFLTVGLGIPLTADWLILYQFVAVILLLFGFRFIHPMFALSITALLLFALKQTSAGLELGLNIPIYQPLSQLVLVNTAFMRNSLLITLFLVFGTALSLNRNKKPLSPTLDKTNRGKQRASYQISPFFVIPLILIIPGGVFTALFDWWPVFSIGNESYSFFVLPILSGFKLTVRGQVVKDAAKKTARELGIIGIITTILVVISYWVNGAATAGAVLLIISGVTILIRQRIRDKKAGYLYGPPANGLRIVGIRTEAPVSKLNLKVGEILTECNHLALETEDDFYAALEANSVYCHLKVKGIDGELRLEETAVYDDDPYGMGLVFLPERE